MNITYWSKIEAAASILDFNITRKISPQYAYHHKAFWGTYLFNYFNGFRVTSSIKIKQKRKTTCIRLLYARNNQPQVLTWYFRGVKYCPSFHRCNMGCLNVVVVKEKVMNHSVCVKELEMLDIMLVNSLRINCMAHIWKLWKSRTIRVAVHIITSWR